MSIADISFFEWDDFGIYFHIPFCTKVCHYCDFNKMVGYNREFQDRYLDSLYEYLFNWFEFFSEKQPAYPSKISSIYFGGGTPGLLTHEYRKLIEFLSPYLKNKAEITCEVNVDNINPNSLTIWKELGINRLSIGVQSFNNRGLSFLTREHTKQEAISAINLTRSYIDNFNVDLIYSWPGQTTQDWLDDIDQIISLKIPHLSLYNLTYEKNTRLGKRIARGQIESLSDEGQYLRYKLAVEILKSNGYCHEEVSNWSLKDYSCRHNWLYWQGLGYLGIGAGAHGFFPSQKSQGIRYCYPDSFKIFVKNKPFFKDSKKETILAQGGAIDQRDLTSWLYEYVGCGLRSSMGIDIDLIKKKSSFSFEPNSTVARGLERGLININSNNILTLKDIEWFREQGWAYEVINSFNA